MYAVSLALVLPLIAVDSHPPTQSPAELIYRSAETLHDAGRNAEAETFLREAIASTIQSSDWQPAIWKLLSSAHYNHGHVAEAEKFLRSSPLGRKGVWPRQYLGPFGKELPKFAPHRHRPAGRSGGDPPTCDRRRREAIWSGSFRGGWPEEQIRHRFAKERQNARAELLFRRLLAVAGKTNLDRRISAELHHNLGVLYAEDGRLGMARRHIEESIAIWGEVVPTDNLNLLCGQNNLVAVAGTGLAFGRGSDPDPTASSSEIGVRPRGNHMKLMSGIATGAGGRALSRAPSR